jgi:hypothetical protein
MADDQLIKNMAEQLAAQTQAGLRIAVALEQIADQVQAINAKLPRANTQPGTFT